MSKGTPTRNIRVPDNLWEAAAKKARERSENLSEAIRAFLREYAARP